MFARETVILNSSQSWIRDPFSIPNIELLQEQGYLKAAVFAYVPLSSPSKYWDEEKIQRMYWLYKQKFKKSQTAARRYIPAVCVQTLLERQGLYVNTFALGPNTRWTINGHSVDTDVLGRVSLMWLWFPEFCREDDEEC